MAVIANNKVFAVRDPYRLLKKLVLDMDILLFYEVVLEVTPS
jgi:hypothetical protein